MTPPTPPLADELDLKHLPYLSDERPTRNSLLETGVSPFARRPAMAPSPGDRTLDDAVLRMIALREGQLAWRRS